MRLLSRKYSSLPVAVISLLLFAASALAQATSQPAQSVSPPPSVKLNVIVTDDSNHSVTDLRQEDFRVSEDGKPQVISYFSHDEMPVSYGLVVDASGSLRTLLGEVIETGKNVVGNNKPGDETFLMRFVGADSIKIEQGFTSNKDAIAAALDDIYVEGGYTAVIDAASRSVDFLKKYQRSDEGTPRRSAMILITDGEDRGSRSVTSEALTNRLRGEDVQFFVIGLTRMSKLQSSPDKAMKFLKSIAEASGGRAFFPKSPSELSGIVDEIARDLHTQYVIGYTSTNPARDNLFRKVQVSVADSPARRKLNVVARPGYTAR